jgi:hypothetical protein
VVLLPEPLPVAVLSLPCGAGVPDEHAIQALDAMTVHIVPDTAL